MKDESITTNEIQLKYNLISLNELMILLGYADKRPVRNWCHRKRIPIIELGKLEYINKSIIMQIIQEGAPGVGNRPPVDMDTPSSSSKMEAKYVPESKIVAKYLAKYERKDNT